MSKFGWSYPPGCTQRMVDEAFGTEMPCAMCGKWPDDCICPECSVCGEYGNPQCYIASESDHRHGLLPSPEQIQSLAEAEKERKLLEEMDEQEFQRLIDEGYYDEK